MTYTIVEDNLPIGFFSLEEERDDAFDKYFMKKDRFGFKGKI